ncbi:hypothetical protein SERLA73DRAFT_149176 [Serpula lacrymans var. lacrymans S7.3]|uniref:Winged helix-turn helix domain-containing protein n=1 Tax=Serpula lacrymans var. lacrymans (strain S7.3) TaxID=936435 RepID=F8PGA7_SERL3|nr:hypothetical protein SERLA73DRAFT_149176 [Serpula lacrymans var. lacrymans S7.3]
MSWGLARMASSIVPVASVQPQKLSSLEATSLEGCIEWQPEMLLRELQEQLREVCGVEVHLSTILRTLQRQGFTMKKVTRSACKYDEDNRAIFKILVGEHF